MPPLMQTTVAACLKDHYGLSELFNNMYKNGISFQDRIVVAEWTKNGKPSKKQMKNKKFVVLEGNRRVRSFQLLRENEGSLHENKIPIEEDSGCRDGIY